MKVQEGIYKTRKGKIVKVEKSTNSTIFPFECSADDLFVTVTKSGKVLMSDEENWNDLVEYLDPEMYPHYYL